MIGIQHLTDFDKYYIGYNNRHINYELYMHINYILNLNESLFKPWR